MTGTPLNWADGVFTVAFVTHQDLSTCARQEIPMAPTSTRLLYSSLIALGACQPESALERWTGENFAYLSSPSLEVCGGTHQQLDGFIGFVASELGVPVPPGITYTWYDDIGDANCPDGTGGCAHGNTAFSETPFFPHEVAHVVAGLNRMNAWPFFSEGLAVAYDPWGGEGFGSRYVLVAPPGDPLPDPRLSLTLPRAELFYPTAGSFVAFLLSRYGPEPYVAMTQRLPEERDLEVLRQIFREAYSAELDDEADLFMEGVDCPANPFPTLLYDCTMPEVAWETSGAWRYRRSLDCTDDDVTGGYKPFKPSRSVHSVTLDVPAAGMYTFQVKSDAEITVQLGACFGCPWEARGGGMGEGQSSSLQLDAGPYFLRVVGWSTVPANIEVELIQQ